MKDKFEEDWPNHFLNHEIDREFSRKMALGGIGRA